MLDLANLSSAIYEGTSTRQITRKEVEVVVVGGRGGGGGDVSHLCITAEASYVAFTGSGDSIVQAVIAS